MQLTKKNITELSKIKSSFIQFLEENEFKEHKSSKITIFIIKITLFI